MRGKLNVRYAIAIILSLVGVCLVWVGTDVSAIIRWSGIGLIAFAVVLSWGVRCPKCKRRLMAKKQLFLPNYCPHCGEKL